MSRGADCGTEAAQAAGKELAEIQPLSKCFFRLFIGQAKGLQVKVVFTAETTGNALPLYQCA